ncbi:hypothetical protein Q7P35_010064 [Cladosporium inversicolor]
MLLLPIFLAARALAANTYTVTVLDENPDPRTLSIPATTVAGDIISYLTLFPDGVDQDGQTRFVDQTGVPAGETVTSFLDIPPSTTPATTPTGTLTQGLPWHNGHHIEMLTVTEANGSVHEVTRIDQQSTHVTVHAETKSNGDVVLVSSYPTSSYPTNTITPAPTPTHERSLERVRALPFCNEDKITWSTIEPGCWPVYDMIVPTPLPAKLQECTGDHHRTIPFTVATIPMQGSIPTYSAKPPKRKQGLVKEPRDTVEGFFKGRRSDKCEAIQEFIDFGTCGPVHLVAMTGREYLRIRHTRRAWILKYWWVPAIIMAGLLLLCLPCLICLRRHRRRNTQKPVKQEAVTVVEQPVAVVAGNGAGGAGGAAGSTPGGAAGGAGSTVTGTTAPVVTTAPTKAAPATTTATTAPTEVVTTTTETGKDHAGTMRRAAEEGRAGPRVRFDGQPADQNPAAAHQVDGTAELRTGSEVFDVGSMRGRKRNRGDEPL